MKTNTHPYAVAPEQPGWAAAAQFLDALSRRDFTSLSACLDPDVRLRALVPSGPLTVDGATAVAEEIERWFGGTDDFAVADASIGQLRSAIYLRWRIRMQSAHDSRNARVVEQHAFAKADKLIHSLDLLCSGFHPDHTPDAAVRSKEFA